MIRKIRAAWRILFCRGFILCTIDEDPTAPSYDSNLCQEHIVQYNDFISDVCRGNMDAFKQAKEILDL